MEEKHKCKLCLKSFANGRALGGHMRSHMFNLYVNPKPQHRHSPPPSNLSSEEDEDANPKKRFRLRDPEFSSAAGGGGGGSVVLQDRESETESSKNATVRRRSKRIRRQHFHEFNRNENEKKSNINESSTLESLSSISDTSPEEDIAYCLIMLSRDKWTDNESESESESESERTPARTMYRCETCNRIFRSYQALGGHKASHKKIKINHQTQNVFMESKIHECPVCFKVFSSGQALGGHKRSHTPANPVEKQRIDLIDLNIPAPIEDEVSQIEVSVVSDGEIVKIH